MLFEHNYQVEHYQYLSLLLYPVKLLHIFFETYILGGDLYILLNYWGENLLLD